YSVTASKPGYNPQTVTDIVVGDGATVSQDFTLTYEAWEAGPAQCFELTRIDAEYFPATGLVYILGGRGGADGSATIGTIYSFNPVPGECQDTDSDKATPISNYTINMVNNGTADVMCTFGGRNSTASSTNVVQCYDPIANTASNVTTL